MKALYYKREDCRLCGSKDVSVAVSLASMPIATPNFSVPGATPDDPIYTQEAPLDLYLCHDCGHVQILHVGNREFQYNDYVYTTSSSLGLNEHFAAYAAEVVEELALRAGDLVVELGSNDGTLLRYFKNKGMQVVGVDPARRIAHEATQSGIETLPTFFSAATAEAIRGTHGFAKTVVANNMIANIDDLGEFARSVRGLLAADGIFVFETQYGKDVFEKCLLDTIYHEHLSYLNVKPLITFFSRLEMEVFDVKRIPTKGGSIRVYVQLAGAGRVVSPMVAEMVTAEETGAWFDLDSYKTFAAKVAGIRERLIDLVDSEKSKGNLVAGYGVSVGTLALLPQFGLSQKIDFLIDDNPNRDPVLRGADYTIPVLQGDAIYEKKPGLIVVFAWRYAEPIMKKHQKFSAAGGKFVVPLPAVTIL